MHLQGSFQLKSWEEETYQEDASGAKMTRATVTQAFDGDIKAEGATRWLMAYRSDGTARFVGLQHVNGAVRERNGTFVLETAGDFDGKMARWHASVVPGSGTGDLVGISGQGTFGAPHGPEATFDLEIDFQ